MVKKSTAKAGDIRDASLISGSGRYPGEGNGNLLQYSCLGNPMDRGTWWATVQGVTKSRTQLTVCTYTHTHTHTHTSKTKSSYIFRNIFKANTRKKIWNTRTVT